MKKLLLIGFLFVACSKEEDKQPVCVTCELHVDAILGVGSSIDYIEQTKQVCDDSYKSYNNVTVDYGGTTNHGVTTNTKKTWICK